MYTFNKNVNEKVNVNENFCISYENVVTNEIKYLQVDKDDLELTEVHSYDNDTIYFVRSS